MDSKYKEPHKVKNFDFTKYQTGIFGENTKHSKRKNKFDPKRIDFDDFDGTSDMEPIQTDISDAGALFNSEDAIVYDINKTNST